MDKKSEQNRQTFATEADVKKYFEKDQDNNKVVIFEGVVYNVKDYMPNHPGGEEYLEKNLGKSIDQDFEEAEHTKSARKIFNDLPLVGFMENAQNIDQKMASNTCKDQLPGKINSEFQFEGVYGDQVSINKNMNRKINFNYDKGLIYQIYAHEWTFDDYYQYINEPKHLINPYRDIRMFDHPFLEVFSKTPYYVVPIAWMPLCIHLATQMEGTIPLQILFILIGIFAWGLAEYLLHRFLFHGEDTWMKKIPLNGLFYAFHFTIHGIHHAFPQDAMRLVFPPLLGHVLYFIAFRPPFEMFVPQFCRYSMLLGVVIGYEMYDLMHYAFHHSNPKEGTYFKEMKTYHMQHHYKQGQIGFGVSQKFWDKIFNTEILIKSKQG